MYLLSASHNVNIIASTTQTKAEKKWCDLFASRERIGWSGTAYLKGLKRNKIHDEKQSFLFCKKKEKKEMAITYKSLARLKGKKLKKMSKWIHGPSEDRR